MHRHAGYVPLHVHTEYSLLDGAIKIDELVETASSMKMPAVAVTDHGNLFGAVKFFRKAVRAGLKPIIGCEVYVAPESRFERERGEEGETSFHLVLLAKDSNGYKNLSTLVSKAYSEGFYYRPRIDLDLLEQYSGGLVALSSCMKGHVPYFLLRGMTERARELALRYKHILGPENYYLEVQENGLPEQTELNRMLHGLSEELHIGLVATNDCHFLRRDDARAHDILLCIQTGKIATDPNRLRFGSDAMYFKSPGEMQEAFRDLPEAISNTVKIAEMCNFEFSLGGAHLPEYSVPEGLRPEEYLERLAGEGLRERLGQNPPERYAGRLREEISVIRKMGFSSYFLIVWDFVNFSKKKKIPVGPGRGSAAGSLVSYALGITEIDPIKYNLLFERFLNPERISMPDIDMDFCKDRRAEVISYVSEKYGSDHVAQIITFGTMAAKASIRDVGRALDIPYQEVDRIAKLVPNTLNITIKEALRFEPELKGLYDGDPKVKELIDIAERLEGLSRHASTHAAGIVISPAQLTDYVPLYRNPTDGSITTQFDMGAVEKLGLVKFDFLGLKTLTVIDKALKFINRAGGSFSIGPIPFDDEKTYELLSSGNTTGVFQLESRGMKDILVKMCPNRFEDLIALVALYRPGPIGSGMIEDFIKRKKGAVPVKYDLPVLKEILDETYGVILYQEQVMSIANRIANFSLGQADILRRAMGKKRPEEMEKQKEAFIEGAVKNGVPERKAKRLFELMSLFAEYGFNKSHSAAYAYIAYQTAYLKAHYPVEFMAATLSADIDNTEKIVKSINECRKMSIEILPPDINLSEREFVISGRAIRFGLEAVKGVGGAAAESIIEEREKGEGFGSFDDFMHRTETAKVNKKVAESLIKAGAFDSVEKGAEDGGLPAALGRIRRDALKRLGSSNGHNLSLGLFGPEEGKEDGEADGWEEAELLKCEKEALGFYVTGNPLTKYRDALSGLNVKSASDLEELPDKEEVDVAGIVQNVRKLRTKGKSEMMAYLALEDDEGSFEAIVFPELYRANAGLIMKDKRLLVRGTVDRSEKGVKIVAREVTSLDDFIKEGVEGKRVEISLRDADISSLRGLREFIEPHRGASLLYLRILKGGTETLVVSGIHVRPSGSFIKGVEEILGRGAVRVV